MLYALELLAFAVLGSSWTDESWYFNDGVMYSHGHLPYVDFFYHRLPIFLIPYGAWYKIVGVSLLKGRILSALFALGTLRLVALTSKDIGGQVAAVVAVALVVFNPFGSYYLTQVATYSCGAFLVTTAVFWFVRKSGSRQWNLAWSGLFLALAWGLLYPVSQAAVWAALFLLLLAFSRGEDRRSRWFGLGGFLAGLIPSIAHILVAPSNALFSTVTWNFGQSALLRSFDVVNLDFQTLLRLQVTNQIETVKMYFVIWLVLLPALLLFISDRSRRMALFDRAAWVTNGNVFFMSLIVLVNELFYMVAPQSSADQRTYVLPIAACLCGIVVQRVWQSLHTREQRTLFGVTAAVLLVLSLFVQERPRLSLRRRNSDLAAVRRIADRIQQLVPPGERILTFAPAVAGQSGRELVKGLAMEYYTIVPTWSAQQIGARPMMNIEGLRTLIRSQTPGAIVLDDARFFSDEHMGRLMRPYRDELLAEIAKTYVLRDELNFPPNVYLGTVRIYLPLRLARNGG